MIRTLSKGKWWGYIRVLGSRLSNYLRDITGVSEISPNFGCTQWLGYIFLFLISTCVCAYLIVTALAPEPVLVRLYYIRHEDVKEICEVLDLPSNDPFCEGDSDVHVDDFESMLMRRFPSGRATYDDLRPYLQNLRSRPYVTCADSDSDNQYAVGNCPRPSQQLCYRGHPGCQIYVTDRIHISISFTNEGFIDSFQVPSGGT